MPFSVTVKPSQMKVTRLSMLMLDILNTKTEPSIQFTRLLSKETLLWHPRRKSNDYFINIHLNSFIKFTMHRIER